MENLGLSCLTTRRVRSDLIQTFKIINGIDKVEKTLFFRNWSGVRRGHSNKLFKKRSRLDIRKYAFSNRTVDKWKSLTQDCINCTTINTIKCHIQKLLEPTGTVAQNIKNIQFIHTAGRNITASVQSVIFHQHRPEVSYAVGLEFSAGQLAESGYWREQFQTISEDVSVCNVLMHSAH